MSIEEKIENIRIMNAGLQATLTQRNQRITQLEEQLKEARSVSAGSREYKKAYKEGYLTALHEVFSEADASARALGKLVKGTLNAYNDEKNKR